MVVQQHMMSGQMVVREIDAPQEHVGARILVIGDFFDARRHLQREAQGQGTGDGGAVVTDAVGSTQLLEKPVDSFDQRITDI